MSGSNPLRSPRSDMDATAVLDVLADLVAARLAARTHAPANDTPPPRKRRTAQRAPARPDHVPSEATQARARAVARRMGIVVTR